MKRPSHESFKKEAFKISGVKEGYDELEEKFAFIAELIRVRKMKGKSQKEVADSMKTTASVISRLEAGYGQKSHSPSLKTLRRYANALDCHLSIKLVPDAKKKKEA